MSLAGKHIIVTAGPSGSEESLPPGDTRPIGERVDEPPSSPGPAELLLFVAGLPSALYLGWQVRRHPTTNPAEV